MTLLRSPLATAATLALVLAAPSLSYAFGSTSTPLAPPAVFSVKAAETAPIILDQSFAELSAMPADWVVHANNPGRVYVQDGALLIDGRAGEYTMTGVSLPQNLLELENYRIDVQFTVLATPNATRWASIMYRTSAADQEIPAEPYYQFAMRHDMRAAAGTEQAFRQNAQWSVRSTASFPEVFDPNKTYDATVIVHGNRVQQYLNGQLLHDMPLDPAFNKGGIGLQTAGMLMRVDRITVTEQNEALPEPIMPVVKAQEPATGASMAPTLVDMGGAAGAQTSRASNAYYSVGPDLQLVNQQGQAAGPLLDYLRDPERVTIPALYVDSTDTIDAMKQVSEQEMLQLKDLTLISSNIAVLQHARAVLPATRAAVDFSSLTSLATDADVVAVVSQTNQAGAKIAILPEAVLSQERVAHLQRLLITVWADSAASTAVEAAEVLLTGVNGVVADHAGVYAEVLAKLPANTLLRKPLVVGHRGMPGRVDENTLEGAKAAVEVGAEIIESDVFITSDDVIVVMHDYTVDRTTDGTGNVEGMTLEQVRQLRTTNGYAVPTLGEYLAEFKGQPVSHFIEIKSGAPRFVPALKKLVEEQGVEAQAGMISFSGDQIMRARQEYPSLSAGFLTGSPNSGIPEQDLNSILTDTQRYSSTFNPSYGGLAKATIEAAKHRGTTFWPWTLRDQNIFNQFYSWGVHGLTTDDAYWAEDFPVKLQALSEQQSIAVNDALQVPVQLTTPVGVASASSANTWVYLGGTSEPTVGADGSLSFSTSGSATMLPGYRYQMGGDHSYVIFGAPLTVAATYTIPELDVAVTTPQGGDIQCGVGEQHGQAVCSVLPQEGYRVVTATPSGTCGAGQWDATFSNYTVNDLTEACSIEFDFEAAPVSLDLGAVGQSGQLQLGASGGGEGLWRFDDSNAPTIQQPQDLPEGVRMPYGVVSFALVAGSEGAAAEVVLTYPEALPAGAKYYKFGPTQERAEPHWYVLESATIAGNTVRLSLQDGGLGDSDLAVNGMIRDPGGVGITAVAPTDVAQVPTTGVLGLFGISAALAALGMRQRRKAGRVSHALQK